MYLASLRYNVARKRFDIKLNDKMMINCTTELLKTAFGRFFRALLCYNISMIGFLTDIANLSFVIGALAIYAGLTISGSENAGLRIFATPVAIFGVFGVGYSVAIFLGAVTGLVTVGVFGSIVCFALFRKGIE